MGDLTADERNLVIKHAKLAARQLQQDAEPGIDGKLAPSAEDFIDYIENLPLDLQDIACEVAANFAARPTSRPLTLRPNTRQLSKDDMPYIKPRPAAAFDRQTYYRDNRTAEMAPQALASGPVIELLGKHALTLIRSKISKAQSIAELVDIYQAAYGKKGIDLPNLQISRKELFNPGEDAFTPRPHPLVAVNLDVIYESMLANDSQKILTPMGKANFCAKAVPYIDSFIAQFKAAVGGSSPPSDLEGYPLEAFIEARGAMADRLKALPAPQKGLSR